MVHMQVQSNGHLAVSGEDVDEELEEAGETLSGLPAVFVPGVTHLL